MPVILTAGRESPEPEDPQPWAGWQGVPWVSGTAAALLEEKDEVGRQSEVAVRGLHAMELLIGALDPGG